MPKKPIDHTLAVLTQIRDAIGATNVRLDKLDANLSARIDRLDEHLSARIDETNERLTRLENRVNATEIRLATELVAVAGSIRELTTIIREEHGTKIYALETRVERLEASR